MCRPPSSDGGPVVSYTQHPVGNRVSPSRCTSAFWQVRHGAGDPATARRFKRASPRDIDWLSSDVRREGGGGDSPARHPRADSRCTSPVALPRTLHPDRFEHATAGYVDRPQAGWGSRHRPGTAAVPAVDRPFPFAPPPAIQLRSPR